MAKVNRERREKVEYSSREVDRILIEFGMLSKEEQEEFLSKLREFDVEGETNEN